MTKILFLCHGNICRSPMAEFVMKEFDATYADVLEGCTALFAAIAGSSPDRAR